MVLGHEVVICLRIRGLAELERSRVDIEPSQLSVQRGWDQLIILQRGQEGAILQYNTVLYYITKLIRPAWCSERLGPTHHTSERTGGGDITV